MQSTDGNAFRNLISGMSRLYGQEPDALVLDAYWIALGDWEFDDFAAACAQLMKTAKFMPKPADFNELREAGEETAGEAFADIQRWLVYSPHGYSLSCETPPKIASCIRAIGGAQAGAMCEQAKLPFLERRFCEHFAEIGAHMAVRDTLPQIAYGLAANDRPALIAGAFRKPGA